MIDPRDIDKTDIDALIRALEMAGAKVRGRSVACPYHDDRTPSAGIYEADAGTGWRFKCQVCDLNMSVIDVVARNNNRDPQEMLREVAAGEKDQRPREKKPRLNDEPKVITCVETQFSNADDIYVYRDYTGAVCLKVVRLKRVDGKKFIQCSPVSGGWIMKNTLEIYPLYAFTAWAEAETLYVCEGEKAAKALLTIGIPATTALGGAGKASMTDWSAVQGKRLVLWPDNDDAGVSHMHDVAEATADIASSIINLDPAMFEAGHKDDAWDYIAKLREQGATDDDILSDIKAIEGRSLESNPVVEEIEDHLSELVQGLLRPMKSCWPIIDHASGWLKPGDLTVFVGGPSSGKSTFLLQMLIHMHSNEERPAYIALEKDRPWWARRLLNLRTGMPEIENNEWAEKHSEELLEAYTFHKEWMTDIMRCMHVPANMSMTYDEAITEIEGRMKRGFKLIMLDPVTALETSGKKIWDEQKRLFSKVSEMCRQYRSHVIIVNHTKQRTNSKAPDAGDMAGSAELHRFCDNMLWLDRLEPAGYFCKDIYTNSELAEHQLNRRLVLIKARSGRADGAHIGMNISNKMVLSAHGLISYTDKQARTLC